MARKTEEKTEIVLNAREAVRKGWLAYIGLYGAAYERANALVTGKGADMFEGFVAKGEEVETRAQDAMETVRERAQGFYGERFNMDRMTKLFPNPVANKNRVEELEAEVEALTKKVATLSKKPAAKRTTKKAA